MSILIGYGERLFGFGVLLSRAQVPMAQVCAEFFVLTEIEYLGLGYRTILVYAYILIWCFKGHGFLLCLWHGLAITPLHI